ncbi:MAG TPA: hypothetical protein DEP84_00900 [Chloroflexi bacterium]|nr:hypothetical protein [Chloroflexota bacterium]
MNTQLTLFEDVAATHFLPLTWTRPVYELRSGIFTLGEKLVRSYGCPLAALFCRPHLAPALAERTGLPVNHSLDGPVLLLNGRLVATPALRRLVPPEGPPALFVTAAGEVAAARLTGAVPDAILAGDWPALPREELPLELWQWPWELIHHNAAELAADAPHFSLGVVAGQVHPGAHLIAPENIYIAPGARIAPGVVLDASDGPIVIGAETMVMPNAVLIGPLAVGAGSRIKVAARLYEGTTVGPVCKVGGEVEATIFQAYSNKAHDGFVGHSLIGAWCNFGADTNTSDLKNNYSSVRIWTARGLVDSGQLLLGTLMGDHAKTGINTTLNTGTVVGVAANLFGAGLIPKLVPSFSWGSAERLVEYRFDRALVTAQRVMARRGLSLSPVEAELLQAVFDATGAERREAKIDP